MNKPGIHRFEIYEGEKKNSKVKKTLTHEFPMFEGQKVANRISVVQMCDVSHWVYNNALGKWDYLGTYHADGTATNFFGETLRFTGIKDDPWGRHQKGGEE